MKILLDEQIPVKLKYRFNQADEIYTVRDMKWLGMKDLELFSKISVDQFQLFITNDKNLKFQINSKMLSFSLIDLNFFSNRYDDLLTIMPAINSELRKLNLSQHRIFIFKNSCFIPWQ